MLLLTERTAALQRTAEPGCASSGGCGGDEGSHVEGGPEEAALVSSEVELVCRGAEWLRHYAELNQVAP